MVFAIYYKKNMQKNGVKLMRFINNILKIDEFKITENM